jgi:gentisate 1,2-dioxygenase
MTDDAKKDFYERLARENTGPLWEISGQLAPAEPRTGCEPALWKYDTIRKCLLEAGAFISAREAQRRVLMLENPARPGSNHITKTLFAGIQLILPGEIAPSHRHVASALRLIIEGEGAYTAIGGERVAMRPGDFVVTPSWTFHDHGNPTDHPVMWMDGLDTAIVNAFDCSFFEIDAEEKQGVRRSEGDARARYGANLLPVGHKSSSRASPLLIYPYERTREVLEQMYKNDPLHPCHGTKMQYVNPETGGYPFPTIAAFIQLLPSGFNGTPYRSTDATVYCVTEGRGSSTVGTRCLLWKEHDIFVVPSWHPVAHKAEEHAVLFSFSDRAAQQALGFWREQILA